MYIVIDIGGTKTEIGFFETLNPDSIKHSEKFETFQSFQQQVQKLYDIIKSQKGPFESINISFPGEVDKSGRILQAPNIPEFKNSPLKYELSSRFSLKTNVIQDSQCSALAEFNYGNIKQYKRIVHLILGTGLGGSLIENEAKLRIMPIEPGGQIVEALDGRKHEFNETNGLLEAYVGGGNVEYYSKIKLSEVSDEDKLWEELTDYLAIGVNNINCLLKPEVVILGGGISLKRPFLAALLNQKIEKYNDFLAPPLIELTSIKTNSSLLGALAFNKVKFF